MLYENVIEQMQKKGYSVRELERKAGVANCTIAKWKTVSPRVETLQKVAKALGVSVSTLLK